jgi:heat shock protein HslJ
MRPSRLALAALLAALSAAAPARAAEAIVGSWRVVSIGGVAVPPDAGLAVVFGAAGEVTGETGCNSFSGSYEVRGDGLTIGAIRATQRGCGADVMERENRLMRTLGTARRVAMRDGGLVLDGSGGGPLVLARD